MTECDICGNLIDESETTTMNPIGHDAPEGAVCSEMSCVMAYMIQNASDEMKDFD
jgi:hypothetical protein